MVPGIFEIIAGQSFAAFSLGKRITYYGPYSKDYSLQTIGHIICGFRIFRGQKCIFFTQILWIFFKFWYDSTRKNFEVDNLRAKFKTNFKTILYDLFLLYKQWLICTRQDLDRKILLIIVGFIVGLNKCQNNKINQCSKQ